MDSELAQKAITAAISGNWKDAIKYNKLILSKNPKDVDALNRLAKAYCEEDSIDKAKKLSQKVVAIDPFNSIAQKALKKYRKIRNGENDPSGPARAEMFIEESGKTKIVKLLNLGAEDVIANLDYGDEVQISPHGHRVSIVTKNSKYIGRLPDDLSSRLKKLIACGNCYQAIVKSIEPKEVTIFIRETKRAEDLADVASFSTEKIDYISFTPPQLVSSKDSPSSSDFTED